MKMKKRQFTKNNVTKDIVTQKNLKTTLIPLTHAAQPTLENNGVQMV
jgi:hypothetical protein